MRDVKTAVRKIALFALLFSLMCMPVLWTYVCNGTEGNNIRPQLEAEKGKIDFLFCGASQAVLGFVPGIMDEALGCNSFNIAAGMLSMEGRYVLLTRVAEDNPVKTLVMDLSYNGLARDPDTDPVEADLLLEERLHGADRLRYFCTHTAPDELFPSFWYAMRIGALTLFHSISGNRVQPDYAAKGFRGVRTAVDQTKPVQWKAGDETRQAAMYDVADDNLLYLDRIMQFCREKGIRVCFVTTAYPTASVSRWPRDGMLYANLNVARKYGCPLYDYNLFRQKDAWFSDRTSYCDQGHTSPEGAAAQTKLLASWIAASSPGVGEDEQFYADYAEMVGEYLRAHGAAE